MKDAHWLEARGLRWLVPDWPVAGCVRLCAVTRCGGVSEPPWAGLNLSLAVGDRADAVMHNRERLEQVLELPHQLAFPRQVHGVQVVDARSAAHTDADAVITGESGQVCALMTADCLPAFFAARDGSVVGVAHAGWKGLLGGVLERCIATMAVAPDQLCAWLGPAIGSQAYLVGADLYQMFGERLGARRSDVFTRSGASQWYLDLYGLARLLLSRAGLEAVYGGGCCTWTDAEHFYSYRRSGHTGRQGNLIWIERSRT